MAAMRESGEPLARAAGGARIERLRPVLYGCSVLAWLLKPFAVARIPNRSWHTSENRMQNARALATLSSLFLLISSFAANSDSLPMDEREDVTVAERHSIQSKILKEKRTYLVHKPGGYDFTNDKYPVIVLLDGEANIQHVSASADFLANNGRAMPMIVVGIENTDRQRDLTPPTSVDPEKRPKGNVGGAKEFLSFIADELLPHIDSSYRTRPTRILIGHSYGGLFASYALLNRPEVFKAYISVSPSLWWDEQALANQAVSFAAEHKDLRTAMYVTMGSEGGSMLGGTQKFVGALTSASNGIEATFQHWPDETHGSVVLRSVYEGLKWLHEFYYTVSPIQTYEVSGLASFDKRFEFISSYLGYEVKPLESELMQIQNFLRETKRFPEARVVLERIVALHPHATNARFDLGRVYVELGEKERAQEAFTTVLKEYPGHVSVCEEIEKLGVDPKTLVADANLAARTLRKYVGEYRYSDETSYVTIEDGKFFVRVRNDKHELRALSDTEFYAVDLDREYTFNDKRGRISSVTVRMPEFTFDSVRQ